MQPTALDQRRAAIDAAITRNDLPTAYKVAADTFPRCRQIIEAAQQQGNTFALREVCGITAGCEWVDNEFMPGSYTRGGGVVAAPIFDEPKPEPIEVGEALRQAKPLFGVVLVVGGLAVAATFFYSLCTAILSGVWTGAVAAGAVIGEFATYAIGLVITFFVVRYLFMSKDSTKDFDPKTPHNTKSGPNFVVQQNLYITTDPNGQSINTSNNAP